MAKRRRPASRIAYSASSSASRRGEVPARSTSGPAAAEALAARQRDQRHARFLRRAGRGLGLVGQQRPDDREQAGLRGQRAHGRRRLGRLAARVADHDARAGAARGASSKAPAASSTPCERLLAEACRRAGERQRDAERHVERRRRDEGIARRVLPRLRALEQRERGGARLLRQALLQLDQRLGVGLRERQRRAAPSARSAVSRSPAASARSHWASRTPRRDRAPAERRGDVVEHVLGRAPATIASISLADACSRPGRDRSRDRRASAAGRRGRAPRPRDPRAGAAPRAAPAARASRRGSGAPCRARARGLAARALELREARAARGRSGRRSDGCSTTHSSCRAALARIALLDVQLRQAQPGVVGELALRVLAHEGARAPRRRASGRRSRARIASDHSR